MENSIKNFHFVFRMTSLNFSAESLANENIIAKAPQSKENIQLYTNTISDIIDKV